MRNSFSLDPDESTVYTTTTIYGWRHAARSDRVRPQMWMCSQGDFTG
ncbi:MAG: hypothetical protein GDA56_20540 [Hormoscilla sp. GM7CHS1pb]|nr:hypothetical protein [Hormoscilla sp. GM7CHS1pb]